MLHRMLAGLLLACGLMFPARPLQAVEQAEEALNQLQAACRQEATTPASARTGRQEDLELFVLAQAWKHQGLPKRAAAYLEYLRTYFPHSPLTSLAGPVVSETGYLEQFDADPDFSRLIKAGCTCLGGDHAQATASLEVWLDLISTFAAGPERLPDAVGLQRFLEKYPDSPLAGWAAYELVWEQRLVSDPESGFHLAADFAAAHPGHPLAQEAAESLDLPWFKPQALAFRSILLPGWGEDTLDPGMRMSSGQMYSEVIYALGLIGFSLAGRQGNHIANLTGVAIFANLLMLNHVSSANHAFQLARHRNGTTRSKFIATRLDQAIIGSGRFAAPELPVRPSELLAKDLVLSLLIRPLGLGEAVRNQGLIDDSQLTNAGFQAEFLTSLVSILRSPGFGLDWAAAPAAWFFTTHADALGDSPLTQGVDVNEWAADIQTGLLARVEWDESWMQVRVSLGPAFRQRSLQADAQAYSDQGLAGIGTFGLAFGGPSGCYWQAAVSLDRSATTSEFTLAGKNLTAPTLGLTYQFSLAIRF